MNAVLSHFSASFQTPAERS